jgi:glyoxylase-like metal-dependent hydrolase (beta-lactamase superfamily II)
MHYFLIFFLLSVYSFGFDYQLKPYPLTKNIDCFFGLHDKAQESNGGRVINTCYLKSDDGYVVIDSGPTYAYAQQAYTAMQRKEKLPVKYVINTSADELHILGNEFYKEQGATLIGPKSYEKKIKEQKPLSMLEKLSSVIFENTRLVPLDIYQDEDKTLQVGKTKIEIKKLEKGESKNLVIYVPTEESIFVGNYISNKRVPKLKDHASLEEWMKNLETIEKLPWEHIISAHGVKRNRKALSCTKNYLSNIKKNVLDSIKNHKQNVKHNDFGSCQNIAFFQDFHTDNIQKAFDELKTKVTLAKKEETKAKNEDEKAILAAMSNIETKKLISKKESKKETPMATTVAKVKKDAIKISKVEKVKITKDLTVETIIHHASKNEIAPTTEELIPSIHYDKDFYTAQQHALREHKMVLIKIEADNCHPCEELNSVIANNKNIRKMINTYTKAIKVNTSYESVPLGLTNRGTPTVFIINPETEKVLMKLEGEEAIKELEVSLHSLTSDLEKDINVLALLQ